MFLVYIMYVFMLLCLVLIVSNGITVLIVMFSHPMHSFLGASVGVSSFSDMYWMLSSIYLFFLLLFNFSSN